MMFDFEACSLAESISYDSSISPTISLTQDTPSRRALPSYLLPSCPVRSLLKYGRPKNGFSDDNKSRSGDPGFPKFWLCATVTSPCPGHCLLYYQLHRTMIPTLDFLLPSLHPSTLLDVSFPLTGPGTTAEPIVRSLPIKYSEFQPVGIVKRMVSVGEDLVSYPILLLESSS
jgi:hypothetical protein